MRKFALALALACAFPALGHGAGTEDAQVTQLAKQHYKAGLEAYKTGNYTIAIKELKRAHQLKPLAALLLNIGATYRKMGDNTNALHYYQRYLAEAPEDVKDRAEVEKIVAELGGDKAPAHATAAAAAEPPAEAAAPPKEWHTVVDAAPPDTPLDLRVHMPAKKGVKVYVYYRGAGEANFTAVLARRHGAEKVGRIPASAMAGKSIQYYVEARDAAGAVLRSSGSQSDPNIVMLDPSAKPQMVADEGGAAAAPSSASDDEASGVKRELDDEAAPIMGEVAAARAKKKETKSSGSSGPGAVFWTGLAASLVGAGSIGGGLWAYSRAKQLADALSADSQNPAHFRFNDPTVQQDDRAVEAKGKWYNNTVAPALVGAGAGVLGVGLVLMIVDRTALNHKTNEKPKRPNRFDAFLTPSATPTFVGAASGFRF
jgi:tetratricopeptide (TPR) repeat protein